MGGRSRTRPSRQGNLDGYSSAKKLISFVIPTRDEALYVGATLSAIRQALIHYPRSAEIIVVDGGSTDDTAAQARNLADRVIVNNARAQRNIAAGRNVGATASRGELLFHTDADVRFENLPRLLRAIEAAFLDTRLVAVTMALWPYPWEARKIDLRVHMLGNALIRVAVPLGGRLARGECLVIRREIFKELHGFDERIALGEDCDLFRRASRLGRVAFLSEHHVYHSPRRFRQWGYSRVALIFAREALWQLVLRRPYEHEWKPAR